MNSSRFPFPPYPTGWFRVAFAAELEAAGATPVPLSFFGRELIAFRDAEGAPRVLGAHCPHLGAHLGYGGRVEGGCVVCPFHGWRFDAEGRNVEIPYRPEGEVNGKATLAAFPAQEWAGMVMVWFDADGRPPSWEPPPLPELDDPGLLWRAPAEARWRIRTHPQEVFENTVDIAHFRFVHGVSSFGALASEEHGAMLRTTAELALTTPRGPVTGAVQNELWGLGIDVNRVIGIGPGATIVTVTPVDGELVDVAYVFLSARDPDGEGGITRAARGHVRDNIAQIEADFPIWEHKAHHTVPALAKGEGPILDFRRWAAQFYPAP